MDIGQRLKTVREKHGVSGNSLAKSVGLHPSQISKIENGATKPSFDALERICDVLGITMAEFFAEDKPAESPSVSYIINHAEHMTLNEEQKAALEIYKKMPLSEQQQRLNDVFIKLNSLPAADREAIERIITSLSARQ